MIIILRIMTYFSLFTANCSVPEDIVTINSTESQLIYSCDCSINIISMMIVKTAVCVGNGTWLPQVLCRADDCIKGTDSEGRI